MKINRIDHIAIATNDAAELKFLYHDILGLNYLGQETVESEKVETSFYDVSESKLEFLEPTSPESTVAKYLNKRGPGLHHIALNVEDLDGYLVKLKENQIQLINDEPILGAHHKRIIFIHPKATGGVLIELCEDKK
jgi:methylmalonyl-CoA epimerase